MLRLSNNIIHRGITSIPSSSISLLYSSLQSSLRGLSRRRCLITKATTTTETKNEQDDAKPTTAEPMMKRTEFEEKYHLARSLSTFDIDVVTQKRWEKIIRKKQKLSWNVKLPDQLLYDNYYNSAKYEMDTLEEIHERSYQCNVLLEIRDVRLPSSTHHPSFTRLAKHRLHLICYTHADLIDTNTRDYVENWTKTSWPNSRSIFIDTRENKKNDIILPTYNLLYISLIKHLENSGGINTALTVGVPNTGKSSVLLALIRLARQRGEISKKLKAVINNNNNTSSTIKKDGVIIKQKKKKKKTTKRKVGNAKQLVEIEDKPGKTRVITEYLIRDKPRTFFLDVPGMTPPIYFFNERPEAWYGYAAANLIPLNYDMQNDIELQITICNYVLYCMNRNNNFYYVKKLDLDQPTDDIYHVLEQTKRSTDTISEEKLYLKRCSNFLKLFNTGNFGSVILDDLRYPYKPFIFKDEHFYKK